MYTITKQIEYYVGFLNKNFKDHSFFLIDGRLFHSRKCCLGECYCIPDIKYLEYFKLNDISYIPKGGDVIWMEDFKCCENVLLLKDKMQIFHLMLEDITNDRFYLSIFESSKDGIVAVAEEKYDARHVTSLTPTKENEGLPFGWIVADSIYKSRFLKHFELQLPSRPDIIMSRLIGDFVDTRQT